jgi:hypothetical protein
VRRGKENRSEGGAKESGGVRGASKGGVSRARNKSKGNGEAAEGGRRGEILFAVSSFSKRREKT